MRLGHLVLVLGATQLQAPRAAAQAASPAQAPAEFRARRESLMARLPHQILVVRTSELLADVTQPNRLPDPNFYYLAGLPNALGAVLVVDGPARQSLLFAPVRFRAFAGYLATKGAPVTDSVPAANGFDRIAPLDELVPWLRQRLARTAPSRCCWPRWFLAISSGPSPLPRRGSSQRESGGTRGSPRCPKRFPDVGSRSIRSCWRACVP